MEEMAKKLREALQELARKRHIPQERVEKYAEEMFEAIIKEIEELKKLDEELTEALTRLATRAGLSENRTKEFVATTMRSLQLY
ncbi:MAG: hypothetical protein Q7R73_04865 [bacterium]|nr:hypothetical protein [bacterium]